MMNNCGCNKGKEELLNMIMSYNFAVNDLTLFLDTHPEDRRALCLHNEYSQKASELAKEYQSLYGPLTINYSSDTWEWIDNPWPWERGAN